MTIFSRVRSILGRTDSWTSFGTADLAAAVRSGGWEDAFVSRSGLAHRAVWMVPQDALAHGWRTDADAGDDKAKGAGQDVTRDIDADLKVEAALMQAGGLARQHGGAWLWPVVDAEQGAWKKPAPEGPHDVSALHVLSADDVLPRKWEDDPLSPGWMRPSVVDITVVRDGIQATYFGVHTSWLIYVPGAACSPRQRGRRQGYEISALSLYREAIKDYDKGGESIAKLMDRLSYFWVQLQGSAAKVTGGESAAVQEALQLLKEGMKTAGLLVLLDGDKAGWDGPSLGGIKDAQTALAERVSSIEGIPLTLLLGQAPGGLGTDGESGRRSYSGLLSRYRRHRAAPVLLSLYDFILGKDATRRIEWPPTDAPTDLEVAQASAARATRDATNIMAGVYTADEARTRYLDGEETPLPDLVADEVLVEADPAAPPPYGGAADPVAAAAAKPAGTPAKASDVALNGAQAKAMLETVVAVVDGLIPRDSGIGLLVRSFNLSREAAEEVMGSAGVSFEKAPPVDEQPVEPREDVNIGGEPVTAGEE